jgi:membrane-bound ClpP family serine protease
MDILQNIDPTHLPLIAVGVALLCIALFVIGFLLQAVSGIFEVLGGIIEIVIDVMQGGPIAWCGCFLLIIGLAACAGFTYLYLQAPESCAEHPTHFCQWFGFLP